MPIKYRIHPAIGIARVGDSPDDFFIGPEAPGIPASLTKPDAPASAKGRYKDSKQRIKRQGARFRVYEYTLNDAGATTKVREITAAEAVIEWQVHLANRKAAAPEFPSGGRRNAAVPEAKLIIDAGPQKISGAAQKMKRLQGRFMDTVDVPIGDLLTDKAGRLIVLGGFGKSQSVPPGLGIGNFANNDGWCDDTSDGPVRATVKLKGGTETIEADPAWVIVAPPDFAPPIENVITLYDVLCDMTATVADPSLAVTDATKVSFTRDIYPLLRRVSLLHWVSAVAARGHSPSSRGDFLSRIQKLASNKPEDAAGRTAIFRRLRNPAGGGGNMPKLPMEGEPAVVGTTVTPTQYKRMERWSLGKFDADWTGAEPVPTPFDKLPDAEKPKALDRAALESCVGGPFFPGIEVGRILLAETTYDKKRPFRINTQFAAGALTASMAIPWQADFRQCGQEGSADWWPGQRPIQVLRGETRDEWVPGEWSEVDMVNRWPQLGFIIEEKTPGKVRYVESERNITLA